MTGSSVSAISAHLAMACFDFETPPVLSCANTTAQFGGITALKDCDEEVEAMRQADRRQVIYKGLRDIGLPVFEPKGAFTTSSRISRCTGMKSSVKILRKNGAGKSCVVPGTAFGGNRAKALLIHISYVNQHETIEEALKRMGRLSKISQVILFLYCCQLLINFP